MIEDVRAFALLIGCVFAFASCGGDRSPPGDVLVRDSAGVSIVEHSAEHSDTVRIATPLLTIGREGASEYEFFRVMGVQGLSDGRIVVADGGSQQVRLYSAEGSHLQSLGGEGEGPGEFRFLNDVQRLPGDTIAANDARLHRLSLFSPAGELVETISYAQRMEGAPPEDAGVCAFPGYAGLVRPRTLALWDWSCAGLEGREGVRTHRAEVHLWAAGREDPLTLGPFAVSAAYERPDLDPPRSFAFLRLAERAVVEVYGDGVLVTSPGQYAFTVLGADGDPVLRLHDHWPRRPVDDDLRAGVNEARSEQNRDLPLPDSLPAIDGVVIGDGQFWVRHVGVPTDSARHWSVYFDGGRERAIVAFPWTFALTAVLDGKAFGISRNDLGIERIQVFSLADAW